MEKIMAIMLKSDYIEKIKKSQRASIDKSLKYLENGLSEAENQYAAIHQSMKANSYGLKGNLSRLLKSADYYSAILINTQKAKMDIDELRRNSSEPLNCQALYLSRWEKQYYELMRNYIRAISHSVDIIIDHLQILVLQKQGLDHPKTSRKNYNSSLDYYLASRLTCKKMADKLSLYKQSLSLKAV